MSTFTFFEQWRHVQRGTDQGCIAVWGYIRIFPPVLGIEFKVALLLSYTPSPFYFCISRLSLTNLPWQKSTFWSSCFRLPEYWDYRLWEHNHPWFTAGFDPHLFASVFSSLIGFTTQQSVSTLVTTLSTKKVYKLIVLSRNRKFLKWYSISGTKHGSSRNGMMSSKIPSVPIFTVDWHPWNKWLSYILISWDDLQE